MQDQGGALDIGKAFTADGFNFKLTLLDTVGGYQLNAGSTTVPSRQLIQATSSIASIQVFNQNAGFNGSNDMYFNNLVISAVPESSAFWFGVLSTGALSIAWYYRRITVAVHNRTAA